jgi:hypothetical protein
MVKKACPSASMKKAANYFSLLGDKPNSWCCVGDILGGGEWKCEN